MAEKWQSTKKAKAKADAISSDIAKKFGYNNSKSPSVNARLAAAAKAVGRYAKNVAREGRDVATAFGTTQTGARQAKDEMQANRFLQAARQNEDKQMKEFVNAVFKNKKGTRSTIHKTNVRNY